MPQDSKLCRGCEGVSLGDLLACDIQAATSPCTSLTGKDRYREHAKRKQHWWPDQDLCAFSFEREMEERSSEDFLYSMPVSTVRDKSSVPETEQSHETH